MTTAICPQCGSVDTRAIGGKRRECNDCGHAGKSETYTRHAHRPETILHVGRRVPRAPADQEEQP